MAGKKRKKERKNVDMDTLPLGLGRVVD